MVVSMFARIAGIKVESSWGHGSQGIVLCTVRLTRPLTSREASRLGRWIELDIDGDRLHYVCRPQEVEEREERLAKALDRLGGQRRRRTGSRRKDAGHAIRPAPHPAAT